MDYEGERNENEFWTSHGMKKFVEETETRKQNDIPLDVTEWPYQTFWHKFGSFPLYSVQMINFLNKSHEVCILEEASFVQVMLGSGLHVLLAGEDMADFLNVWRSGVNKGCCPI